MSFIFTTFVKAFTKCESNHLWFGLVWFGLVWLGLCGDYSLYFLFKSMETSKIYGVENDGFAVLLITRF
jgi:hypothetical protein